MISKSRMQNWPVARPSVQPQQLVGVVKGVVIFFLGRGFLSIRPELLIDPSFWKQGISSGWPSC